MKKIEVVAVVLIVFWAFALLSNSIMSIIMLVDLYEPERGSSIIRMGVFQVLSILHVLVKFGVAIWLFNQAKRDRATSWVWGLFGLIFGISAAILYFLMQLIEEMKMKRNVA